MSIRVIIFSQADTSQQIVKAFFPNGGDRFMDFNDDLTLMAIA